LIYFIFRDDTYVISFIFACLMIIGEFTAGVRILLEKGLSRYNISEDQHFQENTQKFIFCRNTEVTRRRGQSEPPGAHTTWWHGPALGRTACWCGHPGPALPSPPRVYHLPENLRLRGGGSQIDSAASAGQKKHRERKLSSRQKSAGEIPSRRGKIIVIVTAIELGFIGIIIIITIITRTFITTPSHCNILE
jgi:hypothetical protein